jgi:hypothetical protein
MQKRREGEYIGPSIPCQQRVGLVARLWCGCSRDHGVSEGGVLLGDGDMMMFISYLDDYTRYSRERNVDK